MLTIPNLPELWCCLGVEYHVGPAIHIANSIHGDSAGNLGIISGQLHGKVDVKLG
jgi:hypothetical protein